MPTALVTHADCLQHLTGPNHPERSERLVRVLQAMDQFPTLLRYEAPLATKAQLELAHDADYVDMVLAKIPNEDFISLDPDTIASPKSGDAALRAAGAALLAADLVMEGKVENAFCAIRPPGHHAESRRAMGFCLFNNAAIAARHLVRHHGLARVAILDFDVHHGNGSQEIFAQDPTVFYGSSHQSPLYPGTGDPSERGLGNIVNATLPPVSGSAEFRKAWAETLLPALHSFRPEFVLISAGFDAHRWDPLSNLAVETEDFGWLTGELMKVAAHYSQKRVISLLEGGYDLDALAESTAIHVKTLLAG